MGGGWACLGSDGASMPTLQAAVVSVAPLLPSNCGFDISTWSTHFRERFAGAAIANVAAWYGDEKENRQREARGNALISASGLEGGLIGALSGGLRPAVAARGRYRLAGPNAGAHRKPAGRSDPDGSMVLFDGESDLQNQIGLKGAGRSWFHASLLRRNICRSTR
ncbi:MAG: NAD(P)/FAD-dependent oxidoreductase, partial [Uliginosibacterium sp.]|nr:NAD(P)/FAD-dependent oxidoreductase [Uliginosibacterium sp.]